MPSFDAGGALRTPFGKNQYLASTKDVKSESRTFSKAGIPTVTIDGTATKVLQPGTILAKITSTAEAGKVGVYDTGATDGRQTAANIVGINDTFVPWQLNERDVEVSVTIGAFVKESWCFHYLAGAQTAGVVAGAKTQINGDASLAIVFR